MIEKIISGLIEIDSTARHSSEVEEEQFSARLYRKDEKEGNIQTERQADREANRQTGRQTHTDTLPSKQTNQSPTFSFARNRSSKSDGGKSNTRAPTSAFAAILRTGKLDDI